MDVLHVCAWRSGKLTIDGQVATIEELKEALHALKTKHGAVWFFREDAAHNPTDKQFEIFKEIAEAKVPVSMSTKPDFSDYVGEDGQSHQRR